MLKRLSIILMTVVSLCMADVNLAGVTVSEPLFAYTPFPMGDLPSKYSKKDHPKYAYAPATVFFNGKYHQFYCSNGSDSDHFYPLKAKGNDPWDHVRYRSSKDGVNWSGPKVAMSVNNNFYERAACDPSVVYGDDGYWYMLYTGNLKGYETVVFLARSNYIQGPYFKYTENKKWENEAGHASNPKVVLGAKAVSGSYGIGQQTVVKSPSGGYWVWFTSGLERNKNTIRFVYTTDLTKLDYSKSVEVQAYNGTRMMPFVETSYEIGDVRLDTDTGILYMWCFDGGYMRENSRLVKLYSTNGIDWYPQSVETQAKYPYNFIHNMGVAGNLHGWISGGKYLISFAAPSPKGAESNKANVALKYSINELKNYGFNIEEHRTGKATMLGYWSMWQLLVGGTWKEDRVYYPSDGFEFPKDVKSTDITYFTGDYDGDGVSDLGAVDRSTKKWYIYSSRQGCYIDWKGKCRSKYSTTKKCYVNNNDKCVQVYGEKLIDKVYNAKGELTGDFTFKDFEVIAGDFDGDGKTDIGAVDKNLGRWYIYSSADQRKGVYSSLSKPNYIPWGWKWAGMNSSHKIVVGDYNGDGIADRAIYSHQKKDQNTENLNLVQWFIISSAALEKDVDKGFYDVYVAAFFPFGWTWTGSTINHNAVSGDFDGDGITDRAIYGNLKWYSLSSRLGESQLKRWSWGKRLTGDGGTIAVVGDYDGDGADDMVNVNRSEGKWYIYSSENNSVDTLTWESLDDVTNAEEVEILSGDFDGDHKADPAFVDKTTRTFYVRSSRKHADGVDSKIKSIPRNPNNLIYFAKKGDDPIDEKKPVAPATIKAPAMNVAVDGKKVSVTNVEYGSKVAVFDMLGKKILEAAAGEKSANFEVPSYGKYIVRAGAQSRVIMVK